MYRCDVFVAGRKKVCLVLNADVSFITGIFEDEDDDGVVITHSTEEYRKFDGAASVASHYQEVLDIYAGSSFLHSLAISESKLDTFLCSLGDQVDVISGEFLKRVMDALGPGENAPVDSYQSNELFGAF